MALSKEEYARRRSKGLCVQCAEASPDRVRCLKCADANKASRTARREKRRADGRCTECGEQAEPGAVLCQGCSDARTQVSNARYYRNKAAGKCRMCGADSNGESRCKRHKQTYKTWRKKRRDELEGMQNG